MIKIDYILFNTQKAAEINVSKNIKNNNHINCAKNDISI